MVFLFKRFVFNFTFNIDVIISREEGTVWRDREQTTNTNEIDINCYPVLLPSNIIRGAGGLWDGCFCCCWLGVGCLQKKPQLPMTDMGKKKKKVFCFFFLNWKLQLGSFSFSTFASNIEFQVFKLLRKYFTRMERMRKKVLYITFFRIKLKAIYLRF